MEENKGICRLSIVPVRSKASDTSEQVSQLLFGDHYQVLESSADGKWLRIEIAYDGYQGWIDAKQHYIIPDAYYQELSSSDFKVTLDLVSTILFKKQTQNILLGSVLPITSNELFHVEESLAFNGESKSLHQKRDFEFVKRVALTYLNSPYQWGGRSPFGIDCSGFTQNVFKISGYRLNRDASQQVDQGKLVPHLTDACPGDLAFFSNENGKITHVGIILEDHQLIHASGKVRIDKLTEEGIIHSEHGQLTHKLHSIKRILPKE